MFEFFDSLFVSMNISTPEEKCHCSTAEITEVDVTPKLCLFFYIEKPRPIRIRTATNKTYSWHKLCVSNYLHFVVLAAALAGSVSAGAGTGSSVGVGAGSSSVGTSSGADSKFSTPVNRTIRFVSWSERG